MAIKKSGISYKGVRASQPPDMVFVDREPTTQDYKEYPLGTMWVANVTPLKTVWLLAYKAAGIATWVPLFVSLTPGDVTDVVAGDNINVISPEGPTPTVNLNASISQPATNAIGTEGLYKLDDTDFMHGFGVKNTFIGGAAGSRALTVLNAVENTGAGYQSLNTLGTGASNSAFGNMVLTALTSGSRNSCVGHNNSDSVTTGSFNSSLGGDGLGRLITGEYNCTLGYRSGFDYTGAESSNILISNEGTLGESNTIHIGTQGTGDQQQDTTYIAGVFEKAVGATSGVMQIDNTGLLGSSTGIDGQLLIGSDAGSPAWATLSSSDGTVVITNGANTIDLKSSGGGAGGLTTFITDNNSPAVIDVADITLTGAGVLSTDGGTGSHILTVSIDNGTAGQLLIGGGSAPAWANLVSAGGSVIITEGANSINLEASGTGGGASTFTTDDGNAIAATGVINVLGGTNINTSGATSVVTVNLDTSISLPSTNASGTEGLYSINSSGFMHAYGTDNTFLGRTAGNRTLTVLSSTDNVSIGAESGSSLISGSANAFSGSACGQDCTTGSSNSGAGFRSLTDLNVGNFNSGFGRQSFSSITSGSNNVGLGYQSGFGHTGGDSSNICIGNDGVSGESNTIRIGTHGTGVGEQDSAYIAGIYNKTVGATQKVMLIDSDNKVGSSTGADGELLVGNSTTGSAEWVTLTQGNNITITNGPGSITITAAGGSGSVLSGTIVRYDQALALGTSWLECDGSIKEQSTFPNLFSAVGHSYCLTEFSLITTPFNIIAMAHNRQDSPNDLWVAINPSSSVSTTKDGITWTTTGVLPVANARSVAHNGQAGVEGLWVIVGGTSGANSIATSPDGVTWTLRTNPVNSRGEKVAHNGLASPNGLWVSSAEKLGTLSSPDGITWTLSNRTQYYQTMGIWYDIIDDLWLLSTRANGYQGGRIYSSSTGLNDWAMRAVTDNLGIPGSGAPWFAGVCRVGNKYIALKVSYASRYYSPQTFTSDDGIYWDLGKNIGGNTESANNLPVLIGGDGSLAIIANLYSGIIKVTTNCEDFIRINSPFTTLTTLWTGIYSNFYDRPNTEWFFCNDSYGTAIGKAGFDTATQFQLPKIENYLIAI